MPRPSAAETRPPRRWNTAPMQAAPRCGARTRSGRACRSHAVRGRRRCRMHGGARGSGAQAGNVNAMKHGGWSRAARARRAWTEALITLAETTLAELGPAWAGAADEGEMSPALEGLFAEAARLGVYGGGESGQGART